ncbi:MULTISPECIES: hypothetical protein [Chryseobacterium]|uniref:DUF7847 domain-containing protein n=1 Tax=Chryseobacterium camelliae TaxID=1265445 RepID=A0ABU0TLZ9_9FLAO|nr:MULTISPECIES: hypothetical protein [Chryseobacterium]MDT3408080.1 hypothetical protein [Pseudacidovorax intermedius]MDQ1098065.1 hypothetical protein [Chryseobacterium camelliae]MDQ1101995.1 hypothetical protein [Chryseobacterium sp. SORGH_AS_1048]MDR6085432.1 hypothetical protein [Chryseobacterium sp. SORGH_AS_0909]MDR6129796.1 hypothetical protein [Chryseobacterium sp. SORGH_AS_1175]
MMKLNVKPVNFDFSKYLNGGFEFYKNNFGDILLAYFFCFVMNIIPFCGILGIGNLYRYLHRLRKGEPAGPGDIFDFGDFVPYFILQLIVFAGAIVIYLPMMIVGFIAGAENGEPSPVFAMIMIPYMIIVMIAFLIVVLKAFYMPGLISIAGVKDIKTAWNMSVTMTKNNLLSIFLLVIITAILGQLGIIFCGIGIFLTIPFVYASNFMAIEDALQQIQYDEITEIGVKNEY